MKRRYSKISSFIQKVVEPRTEMEKEGERQLLTDDELGFRGSDLADRQSSGDIFRPLGILSRARVKDRSW